MDTCLEARWYMVDNWSFTIEMVYDESEFAFYASAIWSTNVLTKDWEVWTCNYREKIEIIS